MNIHYTYVCMIQNSMNAWYATIFYYEWINSFYCLFINVLGIIVNATNMNACEK